MNRSRAQKIIGVFSVIELISAIISLLLIVLLVFGLGLGSGNETIATEIKNLGAELYFSIGKLAVNAVLLFIEWRVLHELSYDETKHSKAFTMTFVLIAFELFDFITSIGKGVPANLGATTFSIVVGLFVLYLINGIKKYSEKNKVSE